MLWKLDGLSEYAERRPLTAHGTNLLGLSAPAARHICSRQSRISTCCPSARTPPAHSARSLHNCAPPAASLQRAYDALIAAVAIANRLPLYSCNPADFDGIAQLELRSVPHPGHADT